MSLFPLFFSQEVKEDGKTMSETRLNISMFLSVVEMPSVTL